MDNDTYNIRGRESIDHYVNSLRMPTKILTISSMFDGILTSKLHVYIWEVTI